MERHPKDDNISLKTFKRVASLSTYAEPNSLASKRGLKVYTSYPFYFSFYREAEKKLWYIIESVNGKSVNTIKELGAELKKAEEKFLALKKSETCNPEKRIH